ncbi:MAG TPA: c-type cytochrome domain-containing protein [Verrucomicrobiae bacterium]
MRTQLILSLSCCLTISALGADTVDIKKLPTPAKQKVEFAKDIKPLLDKSCTECHSGEKPKGGYKTDTIEGLTKGSGSDVPIIPGNSAKSPLIHYVADLIAESEMPPTDKREKYPALNKDQIALLRAWIDQGAKH